MPTYYSPASQREEFDVAILCAKKCESDAVEAMFEERWSSSSYGKLPGDQNEYSLGRIGRHSVALGYLPGMGIANAASAASSFLTSFPNVRLGLVVGICGGVPKIGRGDGINTEVLLGDVMISTRVMEYKRGTQLPDNFIEKDTLGKATKEIQGFLRKMEGIQFHEDLEKGTSRYTSGLQENKLYRSFKYPGADRDKLYGPNHRHKHHQQIDGCKICKNCNYLEDRVCGAVRNISCETLGCFKVVPRARLAEPGESSASMLTPTAAENVQTRDPKLLVHFGVVASADLVMKSGHHRDEIVTRYKADGQDIIAFEMEGAGVWDTLPTLVIKGVSDYADSHKRDEWQKFAAARAAACMKVIVKEWSKVDTPLRNPAPFFHNDMIQYGTPESSRSDVGDKIDRAEALIKKRDQKSMIEDLGEARKLLKQVLDQLETPSSHSRRRVYWGLMIVEKELSWHGSLKDGEKISLIIKAENWSSKLLSQKLDTGHRIHLNLERYIIQGRKASLELERNSASVEASKLKDNAIAGIDRILGELKEKGHNNYDEIVEDAQKWRTRILSTSS